MARGRRPHEWRPNANEAPIVNGFNLGVAATGAVSDAGWAGLRWVGRRIGLRLAEPRRRTAAATDAACPRCREPTFVSDAVCHACGHRGVDPGQPDVAPVHNTIAG